MSNEPEKPEVIAERIRCYSIFHHPEGQKVIEDLVKSFGTEAPAFLSDSQGHYDTHRAAIRDGQRQVVLHIVNRLKLATNEQPKKSRKAKTE